MCIVARLIKLVPSGQRKNVLVAGFVENHDSFLKRCREIPSYGLKYIILRGADKEHLLLGNTSMLCGVCSDRKQCDIPEVKL